MLEELLELLRQTTNLAYTKVDDDEEKDEESEETDEEQDSEEDNSDENSDEEDQDDDTEDQDQDDDSEEDEEKTESKTYSEAEVEKYRVERKRLRTENKKRRLRQKETAKELADLQAEVKSGKTADDKKTKSVANSRLEEEITTLREQVSEVTNERNELVELQTRTDQVLTIGRVATEVGFAQAGDAIAFLSTRSDEFTDEAGEIDTDALRSELEELLESKPYLAATEVQDDKDKEKKGRREAAKTSNKAQAQNMEAPEGKQGKSKSEEATNKKIRELLNKQHDGPAAFSVWYWEKFHPTTSKEKREVS